MLFKHLNINQIGRLIVTGTSLAIIISGTFATKTGIADTHYQNFREWCENKSRISPEAKHTVNLLMQQAKTEDCQQAEQYLLEQTNLDLMKLQLQDLSPLSSLTHLTALNLAGNQITNLQPLVKLTNLSFLLLTDNQISDITPLSQLTNLNYVMIDRNQIQTLPSLPNLKQLTALGLMENPITQKNVPLNPQLSVYLVMTDKINLLLQKNNIKPENLTQL